MKNVFACKKRLLALAAAGCLCASLVAVPSAYGFYYVHEGEYVVGSGGEGVIEVNCTVDATALGGGILTSLVLVPQGATALDCLREMVVSSESQNGLAAIHDYGVAPASDLLDGKDWTCSVYEAGSQKLGTHTCFDGQSAGDEQVPLERYDSVVFSLS